MTTPDERSAMEHYPMVETVDAWPRRFMPGAMRYAPREATSDFANLVDAYRLRWMDDAWLVMHFDGIDVELSEEK